MMQVGCYTLDLYCDIKGSVCDKNRRDGWQYTGQTEGQCKKQARRDGWVLGNILRGEPDKCPVCAKRKVEGAK